MNIREVAHDALCKYPNEPMMALILCLVAMADPAQGVTVKKLGESVDNWVEHYGQPTNGTVRMWSELCSFLEAVTPSEETQLEYAAATITWDSTQKVMAMIRDRALGASPW